jgi:hypothetical protein
MGELKIRAVRSQSHEAESRYAIIDTFELIADGHPYFCACEVFKPKYENGMTHRGERIENPKLELKDSVCPVAACSDDEITNVDIPLYLELSQALKNDGYVFNKKLARLYKNPKKRKDL